MDQKCKKNDEKKHIFCRFLDILIICRKENQYIIDFSDIEKYSFQNLEGTVPPGEKVTPKSLDWNNHFKEKH